MVHTRTSYIEVCVSVHPSICRLCPWARALPCHEGHCLWRGTLPREGRGRASLSDKYIKPRLYLDRKRYEWQKVLASAFLRMNPPNARPGVPRPPALLSRLPPFPHLHPILLCSNSLSCISLSLSIPLLSPAFRVWTTVEITEAVLVLRHNDIMV